MTEVLLVRHAAHAELGQILTGRRDGVELSESGYLQTVALAERLRRGALAAIHSSPRRRAQETAAAIATRAGLPVEIAPALDAIDFGDWSGKSFAELSGDPSWRRWNELRGSSRPPHGESMAEATARIVAHIERAARRYADDRVALVSHCDVIRGAVAHFRGLSFDDIFGFDIDPASITTVRVDADGARVVSLNEKVPDD